MKETAWLIERYTNGQLEYWTGRIGLHEYWDPRVNEACRFSREQDAAVVLAWCLKGNGRAVQHMWMDALKEPGHE